VARAAAAEVVAVDQVDGPRRPAGGRDDGVESVALERTVDAVGARQPARGLECLEVGGVGEWPLRRRRDEALLAEPGQLAIAVSPR
jgi:hypothetical protein